MNNDPTTKGVQGRVFFPQGIIALSAHIGSSLDALGGIQHLPFYRNEYNNAVPIPAADIAEHLHLAWGTEYALRANLALADDAFLLSALHWTLPQAYHSTLKSLQAFMYTLGVRSNNPQLLLREVGRLVVKNAYPRCLSFYAAGGYGDFSVHRLPLQGYEAGLHVASQEIGAQKALASALRSSRKMAAQATRAEVQANPNTAIRSPKTGKPLAQWKAEHWQQITWRLGYTTVFSLLADLRAADTKNIPAGLDIRAFYTALLHVVSTINGVHEAYCAKAMGVDAYKELLTNVPAHLNASFPAERFAHLLTQVA